MINRIALTATAAAVTMVALAGCVPNAQPSGTVISVRSTDSECELDSATAAGGAVTFTVENAGERVTEFYLLREDEATIVAEVEDIAPGASRDLTIEMEPGQYYTLCKPGMGGDGVGGAEFTVTADAE